MPQIKAFKNTIGGQITDKPAHEQPFEALKQLQNVIPTAEGLKPLQSVCDAVGPTITNVVDNTVGFPVFVHKDKGYFWTNKGTTGCALYEVSTSTFHADDHANTYAGIERVTNTTTTAAWNTLSKSQQLAVMLKNHLMAYGDDIICKNDIVLAVAAFSASGGGFPPANPAPSDNDIMDRVVRYYFRTSDNSSGRLPCVDGSNNGHGPQPEKLLVHDEYLCAVGGFDGFTHNITTISANVAVGATTWNVNSTANMVNGDIIGIKQDDNTWHWTTVQSFVANTSVTVTTGPTVACASGNDVYYTTNELNEEPERFRWNHPTAIDRWLPSLELPPANLAGYKKYMTGGRFIDVFAFGESVYVVTEDNIYKLTKVGGETGYTLRALNIRPKLGSGALHSVVSTSKGAYILTLEGLYLFNGQQLYPVSAGQTEELFNKLWFREHISDTVFQEYSAMQSIQYGMHVPILDCIFWFVTYGTTGSEKNMILVYNYETNTAAYLLSPANEIWHPLYGTYPGISVYDKTANTVRCFALRPKMTSSTPPDAEIIIDSGFLTINQTINNMLVNRVYFSYESQATNDLLSGLSLSMSGYNQEQKLHTTKNFGTLSDGYTRGFIDVRISGRYVSLKIQGSPNAWTDWTKNLNQSLSVIKSIGVNVIPRGIRA